MDWIRPAIEPIGITHVELDKKNDHTASPPGFENPAASLKYVQTFDGQL